MTGRIGHSFETTAVPPNDHGEVRVKVTMLDGPPLIDVLIWWHSHYRLRTEWGNKRWCSVDGKSGGYRELTKNGRRRFRTLGSPRGLPREGSR